MQNVLLFFLPTLLELESVESHAPARKCVGWNSHEKQIIHAEINLLNNFFEVLDIGLLLVLYVILLCSPLVASPYKRRVN